MADLRVDPVVEEDVPIEGVVVPHLERGGVLEPRLELVEHAWLGPGLGLGLGPGPGLRLGLGLGLGLSSTPLSMSSVSNHSASPGPPGEGEGGVSVGWA